MNVSNIYRSIKAPVVSEKSNNVGERHNQYVFIVEDSANKAQIKRSIESIFSVQVSAVNTCRKKTITKRDIRGRMRRVRGHKKAYVSLAAGQEINLYSGL